MSTTEPTLFERIAAREIPARIVFENERVIAFHDIAPQAPLHLLVTPKSGAYATVAELAAADPALLAEVVIIADGLASEFSNGEYRLVFNSGASAGQTVFHVHAHLLSGGLDEGSLGS
ncbi:HIT domain-containing protein [Galbitalea soli]|uniref:HIT domain-containing protein n=1 Tax=Galbitalea soli TaxID=1268042 RepID=A0A7C9PKM7_9MICO|nr:HIT domain-containing protein [Galbitalea soli]NEM89845.1 HIT domain-containing protein [Galbitalea soli]NYJ30549.1 histidine triad (HIT) family protein [Galbitalea soli]